MLLFTDFDGDPSMSAANGPIKLKLKMFHQQEEQQQQLAAAAAAAAEEAAQAAARQGSKKKRKGPTLMGGGGGASEEESMTKVHQDDEYVYPSLDLSDDEVAPSDPADLAQDDGIWSPKVSAFLQGGRKQSNIRQTIKLPVFFPLFKRLAPISTSLGKI